MLFKNFRGIFFGSFIVCGILLIFSASHDPRLVQYINTMITQTFKESFGGNFTGTLSKIDITTLSITFDNINVTSLDKQPSWKWHAKKCKFQFNPLWFFIHKKIGLSITLDTYHAESIIDINYNVAIIDHLKMALSNTSLAIPIMFTNISIINGKIHTYAPQYNFDATYYINLYGIKQGNSLDSIIEINGGNIFLNKNNILNIQNSTAAIRLNTIISGHSTIHFTMPSLLPQEIFSLSCEWKQNHGLINIKNKQNNIFIGPINIYKDSIDSWKSNGSAKIDLTLIEQIIKTHSTLLNNNIKKCNGILSLQYQYSIKNGIQGDILIKKSQYNAIELEKINIHFKSKNNALDTYHGTLKVIYDIYNISGKWDASLCNQTGKIKLTINNKNKQNTEKSILNIINIFDNTTLKIQALPNTIQIQAQTILKNNTYMSIIGKYNKTAHTWNLKSNFNNLNLITYGTYHKKIIVKKLTLHDKNNQELIYGLTHPTKENIYKIYIPYKTISHYFKECMHYECPSGQGILECNIEKKENTLQGQFLLNNGIIKIPLINNFLTQCNGLFSYEYYTKKLTIIKMNSILYKGNINLNNAYIVFNNHGNITKYDIPIIFNKCFIQINNAFFGLLSSNTTLRYDNNNNDQSEFYGTINLDQGHFNDNLFSTTSHKGIIKYLIPSLLLKTNNMKINIQLKSESPFTVSTSYLKAHANIHININGTVGTPETSGSITIQNGTLHFPAQELQIIKGIINFYPDQTYNPHIELIAQGRIKKYIITIIANGPMQTPEVQFSSIPSLTEEQIISLLFVGNFESTLNMMLPTFIMHNIQSILFGTTIQPLRITSTIQKILAPLNKIRIIPSFADQTGRGGIRIGIEIEANDRLRALIQKNITLTEDTKFEIEYLLSDDVSIKGVKDERGEIGGEIEMRYKF